ncbi:MAG: transposase [Thioalkalivibrio sp.]|nr:transposase [Thioalkalivibrio sp.]
MLRTSFAEVRQVTEDRLELYNTVRPHRSLGRVPPRTAPQALGATGWSGRIAKT